jgi:hypothetical protein
MYDQPIQGERIELVWLGTIFTGIFDGQTQPWGTAWHIIIDNYFGLCGVRQLVARNQIMGWRHL